jgi:cytochrome c oxidase subunit 4
MATWGTLMVLTIITVAASYVNFGPANLLIAVVIATIKATVVAAIFMHLWFDHRMHSMILGSAGLFLAIFIAFTMFDTESRGHQESITGDRPADISQPFAGSARLKAVNALYAAGSSSAKLAAPGVVPGMFDTPAAAPSAAPAPEPTPAPAPPASGSAAPAPSAAPSASAH